MGGRRQLIIGRQQLIGRQLIIGRHVGGRRQLMIMLVGRQLFAAVASRGRGGSSVTSELRLMLIARSKLIASICRPHTMIDFCNQHNSEALAGKAHG